AGSHVALHGGRRRARAHIGKRGAIRPAVGRAGATVVHVAQYVDALGAAKVRRRARTIGNARRRRGRGGALWRRGGARVGAATASARIFQIGFAAVIGLVGAVGESRHAGARWHRAHAGAARDTGCARFDVREARAVVPALAAVGHVGAQIDTLGPAKV